MATEKRLIDANWILGEIEHDLGCYEIGKMEKGDALFVDLRDVVRMVCASPTVDAVEVVRCKDCKHRGEEGGCPMYFVDEIEWDDDGYIEADYVPHDYTVDDGFCDRGERRTYNV
jgi:hypothetical protein